MENNWLWYALGAALVIALMGLRVIKREVSKALNSQLDSECSALRQSVSNLTEELERAREVAQDERSRRERYFEKITDFERERSSWQKAYYEQSAGHGNAQELMMNTIDALAGQVRQLGGTPRVPRVLQMVRDDFEAKHELPAKAALAAESAGAASTESAPKASDPTAVA